MKLIVGLGNPGRRYADSRHNIGISCIKALARFYKISLKKDARTFSLNGSANIENQEVLLAAPFTFMNLSGGAVSALVKKYKIDLHNLLIVYDDLDLELGRIKIRPFGASGGHRGLKDIIDVLGSQEFPRLRIGIGRAKQNLDVAQYVLSPFTKKELALVKETIDRAIDCCRAWIANGITESMNIFNRRNKL